MDNGIRPDGPAIYRIRIMETLGSEWDQWFGGFTVTQDTDNGSILTGKVADQAALHGAIRKLRDLHLTLLSLHRIEIQSEREKMQ
ncbi:MAG: hypothetical protein ABIJ86_12465 [Spirochaetota bacterium]